MTPLLVALGAALGGALRYVVATALDDRWPAGTLLVNVLGSGLLGLVSALALGGHGWALVATGLCGAFTTFSAFAVQAVERPPRAATAYVVATVLGSLGLCAVGWWVGTAIG